MRAARSRRAGRPALPIAGLVAVASTVGAIALCTLVGGFPGGVAVGPVLITTLTGALGALLLLRTRIPAVMASIVDAVAVLLAGLVSVAPRSTWAGAPTASTFRFLRRDAAAARASLAAPGVPYHAVPDLVLVAALVGGMTALLSQFLLIPTPDKSGSRSRPGPGDRRLAALLPSFALVVWADAVGAVASATWLTAAFVTVAAVLLAWPGTDGAATDADRRPATASGWLVPSVVMVVGALAAVAVIGGVVDRSGSPAAGVTTGPASELRLLTSVVGLERSDPDTVVFTATSPVSTYWQLAVLTSYRDGTWQPSRATAQAASGRSVPSTPTAAAPVGVASRFRVGVTVDDLTGHLLPLPPDTETVDASFPTVPTDGGTAVVTALTAGDHYSATAVVPPPVTSGPAQGAPLSGAELAADTASRPSLRPSMPWPSGSRRGPPIPCPRRRCW